MDRDHFTDRLSEYLDGELRPDQARTIEAHLVTCERCTLTLAELREVSGRARELGGLEPAIDLWPAIATRLEPRGGSLGRRLRGMLEAGTRRFTFTLPQLAAATAALVVASVGLTWFLAQRPAQTIASHPSVVQQRVAPGTGPVAAVTPDTEPAAQTSEEPRARREEPVSTAPPPMIGSAAQFASFDATRYDAAVAELQRVLHEHRSELDTTTVRILEQNLAIIDKATEEARRALEADPANPYLNGHLAEQMMRKVRLLQRAADVVAAHG